MLKNLSRPTVIFGLILLLILASGIVSFKNLPPVKAAGDGVALFIKYDISTDNGVTWHNFTGTTDAGGEAITANSGDTVLVRVKTWNTGATNALDVTGHISTTNPSLISSATVLDNSGGYTGFFISGAATGGITPVPAATGSTPGLTFTTALKLSNNFPTGQTIIDSTVTIDDYTIPKLPSYNPSLIQKAYADGAGGYSTIRIVVNSAPLPQTGME